MLRTHIDMVLLFLYLADRQVNYFFHRLKFNDVYFIHIILAQGITLPFFIQEDAAKVGMVVKPYTEHIEGLDEDIEAGAWQAGP